jgi:acyl-CoA hydrolase
MKIYQTALEAVQFIKSNQTVFIHSAAMTPLQLVAAMTERAKELQNVEIVHIHTTGKADYAKSEYYNSFTTRAFFVGENLRTHVEHGNADYIPIFLSEIPLLFRRNIKPIDVALIQVSPPDKHGFCSLGVSVDIALAAVQTAKYVIAQINPQVPRCFGAGIIHKNDIHAAIEVNEPIFQAQTRKLTNEEQQIGKYVASLVEDGATLQMGIGSIPDAVLAELGNHKDLGIHTEMFSDGLVDLYAKGAITNHLKKVIPHKIVSCFVVGSQKVYDFVDNNPIVDLQEASFTNDGNLICKNPNVTAINSAIEIDLTGQVCADSIGIRQFSGVGGQVDFIRGAALAKNGKPIIALNAITAKGESKIVPLLQAGAAVTTTRSHVHYVITEFGIAFLFGKSLKQRAKALIDIAHPNHRENLEKAAFERFKHFE